MSDRRRLEVVAARITIGAAAAFTGLVLLWHFGFDDATWSLPPPITRGGWDAFSLYPWAELLLVSLVVAALLAAVLLRKRFAVSKMITATLIAVVLVGAMIVYAPLAGVTIRRMDRVLGSVEEPLPGFRFFVALFVITLAANGVLIIATRTKHTPDLARRTAAVAAVVTSAIYLHLFWVCLVFPFSDQWWPDDWERADRIGPVRLCRGATLWEAGPPRYRHRRLPIGRIDDLWLNFADPRTGGRRERAISYAGTFYEGYFWLTLSETGQLRVRLDDPALADCDGTWRRERGPAKWHKVGVLP